MRSSDRTPRAGAATGTSRRTVLLALRGGAATSAAALVFNLALLPVVLNRLGPNVYGVWATMAALLAVAALADAGIRTEVSRRVASARGTNDWAEIRSIVNAGTTVTFLIVTPILVLSLALSPWITALLFPGGAGGYSNAALAELFRGLLIAMALSLVLGAHFAVLRGLQRSDLEAVAHLVALPVNASVTILGLLAGLGLWSLFWGSLASIGTQLLLLGLFARRVAPAVQLRLLRPSKVQVTSYLALSGLALFSQVGDVFDSQWDKLVIARFVGTDAVTSFHVGTSLILQAKALAVLPLLPLMVAIAELRAGQPDRASAFLLRSSKAAAVASSTVLGSCFVYLPSFIDLWLGPGYEAAGNVARIFAVAVLLNLMSAPAAMEAFAEGKHAVAALGAFTNMAVNAILSLLLTLRFGLYGAVYGSVAGNLVGTLVFLIVARRKLDRWTAPPVAAILAITGLATVTLVAGWDGMATWWALGLAGSGFVVVSVIVGLIAERLPLRPSAWSGALRLEEAGESQ